MNPTICFDRVQDMRTRFYFIYRNGIRVMKVKHPVQPNPVTITGEAPVKLNDRELQLHHHNIIGADVFVDGNAVPFEINNRTGVILLSTTTSSTNIIVNYTFDGVEVTDSPDNPRVMAYYGPPPTVEDSSYTYTVESCNEAGERSRIIK